MEQDLPTLTMSEIQEIATILRESATNLFRLLENLLEWAKIQQGLIPFEPKTIKLLSIVDECMLTMLEISKNKGIELTYDFPENISVFADKYIIQTVIRNLVSNALKFTPRGGKVSLSAKNSGNKCVEISIRDTGIGMSPKMVENLFRLDVRTNRKGTENEPSSGLGLMLCKEFIERHGGKLWIESEDGKGSVFYFTIPNNTNEGENF
jgi:signal transduction histidine kinase